MDFKPLHFFFFHTTLKSESEKSQDTCQPHICCAWLTTFYRLSCFGGDIRNYSAIDEIRVTGIGSVGVEAHARGPAAPIKRLKVPHELSVPVEWQTSAGSRRMRSETRPLAACLWRSVAETPYGPLRSLAVCQQFYVSAVGPSYCSSVLLYYTGQQSTFLPWFRSPGPGRFFPCLCLRLSAAEVWAHLFYFVINAFVKSRRVLPMGVVVSACLTDSLS